MEVIAKNNKVRVTLRGVVTPFIGCIRFSFRAVYYGGSKTQGSFIFEDISDLTDYLFDDFGCDTIIFNK